VVALVQGPERDQLDENADGERGQERQHDGGDEGAGPAEERGGEIRAHHVERAVREVDEIHDSEDEREPGGHEEQHHAELQAVEALLER